MGFKARKELRLWARKYESGPVQGRVDLRTAPVAPGRGGFVTMLRRDLATALGLDTLPEGKPVRIALSARLLGENES